MTIELSESVTFNALKSRVETLESIPQVVNNNTINVTGGNMTALSTYASFLAALTALGSTPMTLLVDTDKTVSTARVVPGEVKLKHINGAKLIKSGTGALEFQGIGIDDPLSQIPFISGFAPGDITVTGATPNLWPVAISIELFDTGNNSTSDRLNILIAAFGTKQVKFVIPFPRDISHMADFPANKDIEFGSGLHTSTLSTGTGNYHMFGVSDNTYFHGPRTAIIQESSGLSGGRIIEPTGNDLYGIHSNIVIEGLTFKGKPGVTSDGSGATILLGNCHNSSIRNCLFDDLHYYAATLGGYGDTGNYAYNSEVAYNTFIKATVQTIALINAKQCRVIGNWLDATGGVGGGQIVDLEPNTQHDFLDDCTLEDNTILVLDAYDGTNTIGGYQIAGANGGAPHGKGVVVRNNDALGMSTSNYPAQNTRLAQGFTIFGILDGVVQGNSCRWAFQGAYYIAQSRRMLIDDNFDVGSTDAGGLGSSIKILMCADSIVSNNKLTSGIEFPASTGIYESEFYFPATSSGSVITQGYAGSGRLMDFQAGLQVFFNGALRTILSFDNATNQATMIASVGTVTAKTFVDADVNVSTNLIAKTAHGYNTGAIANLSTTGTLPAHTQPAASGLDGMRHYYLYCPDADHIGLCNSLENSQAGVLIDITSASGGGTHTINPELETRFSNNKYINNYAPNGIRLAPTGSSEILSTAHDNETEYVNNTNVSIPARGGIYAFTGLTASRTATLPDARICRGLRLAVKDAAGLAATYNVSAVPFGNQTIEGAPGMSVKSDWGSFKVQSTGANWLILEKAGTITPFFTPSSIASLVHWYKVSDLNTLADNDPVATWVDAKGSATMSGSGTGRPVYKTNSGDPYVQFDGSDDFLQATIAALTDLSVIAIWERVSTTNSFARLLYATNLDIYQGSTSNEERLFLGVDELMRSTAAPPTGFAALFASRASTAIKFRVNGSETTGASNSTATGTTLKLGVGSAGEYANIRLKEVLMFNAALAGTDFTNMAAYVLSKYGLTL